MKIISHRGFIDGPSEFDDNRPESIVRTLHQFECEIDVWYISESWFLGHHEPQYKIDEAFLFQDRLWLHTKNLEAMQKLSELDDGKKQNYFWHETDKVAITNQGNLWQHCSLTQSLGSNAIIVLPEITNISILEIKKSFGICTDYPNKYKKELQ